MHTLSRAINRYTLVFFVLLATRNSIDHLYVLNDENTKIVDDQKIGLRKSALTTRKRQQRAGEKSKQKKVMHFGSSHKQL